MALNAIPSHPRVQNNTRPLCVASTARVVIAMTLTMMERARADAVVQTRGCEALCAWLPAARADVCEAGGVALVLSALLAHGHVRTAYEAVIETLRGLVAGVGPDAPPLTLIVAAMRQCAPSQTVQHAGCALLAAVCEDGGAGVRATVVHLDGAAVVVDAMARFSARCPQLALYGCFAFCGLASECAGAAAVARDSGCAAVVTVMAQAADDALLQRAGVEALWRLAFASWHAAAAVDAAGGTVAVLRAMTRAPTDAKLASMGCAALFVFACRTPEGAGSVLAHRGPAVVLRAMRAHLGVADVQARGSVALQVLASYDAPLPVHSVAQHILLGMRRHAGVAKVQDVGAAALSTILRVRSFTEIT
jgi:hypothetical protein